MQDNKDNGSILNALYNYIDCRKDEDEKEKPEKKPSEYKNVVKNDKEDASSNLQKLQKNKMSNIKLENKIICQNILSSFLGLPDEKFIACMKKIEEWRI